MKNTSTSSNIVLIVVIAILIAILVGCAILIVILRIRKNKKNNLEKIDEDIKFNAINNEIRRYKKLRDKYKYKLEKINDVDSKKLLDDLKEIVDKELIEYRDEKFKDIEREINDNKDKLLKKTILQTMQHLHLKIINESSVSFIPITDHVKPLIIGKKGQNIKKLNDITHCNVNIDRNNQYIEISSPNPFDRTLAVNTIKHLIKSEAFDLIAIENVFKKEKRLLDQDCSNTGKEYLNKLNIEVEDNGICEYIGRLKYRWSFSQNVLEHCYETAIICEQLAKEFNLNSDIAKKIGFFHDIGKSVDYEKKYDHISTGVWLAKKFELEPEVIDGILKHHRTNCYDDYVLLVRCADAWSAARIGARHFPITNQDGTIKIVEDKCKRIRNVFSFKAAMINNEIQIMFIPLINSQKAYLQTKYNIIQAIKKDVRLNKHPIKFVNEIID